MKKSNNRQLSLCYRCKEGRVGTFCECNQVESGKAVDSYLCHRDNASEQCSGHGQCVCGKCVCDKSSKKPNQAYYGQYCECSDFNCDQYQGLQCGGGGKSWTTTCTLHGHHENITSSSPQFDIYCLLSSSSIRVDIMFFSFSEYTTVFCCHRAGQMCVWGVWMSPRIQWARVRVPSQRGVLSVTWWTGMCRQRHLPLWYLHLPGPPLPGPNLWPLPLLPQHLHLAQVGYCELYRHLILFRKL